MASCGSQRVDENTPIMVMWRRGKTTSGAGNFSGGGGKLRGSLTPSHTFDASPPLDI